MPMTGASSQESWAALGPQSRPGLRMTFPRLLPQPALCACPSLPLATGLSANIPAPSWPHALALAFHLPLPFRQSPLPGQLLPGPCRPHTSSTQPKSRGRKLVGYCGLSPPPTESPWPLPLGEVVRAPPHWQLWPRKGWHPPGELTVVGFPVLELHDASEAGAEPGGRDSHLHQPGGKGPSPRLTAAGSGSGS